MWHYNTVATRWLVGPLTTRRHNAIISCPRHRFTSRDAKPASILPGKISHLAHLAFYIRLIYVALSRMAQMFPFTSYDRRRFAAITIRLSHPQCTCLLFGSGKLVITGSTSFYACVVASHSVTR